MTPRRSIVLIVVLGSLMSPVTGESQTVIPEPLAPWVAWVLEDHPEVGCPWLGSNAAEGRECVWPGRLELALGEFSGQFDFRVRADRRAVVALPGGPTAWPRDVLVDGQPALHVDRGENPSVLLEAGSHRLQGHFEWSRLPETLPVPPEIAVVELEIAGSVVAEPRRERDGLLWLQPGEEAAADEDTVQVEVFRRLIDAVPAQLETRVELRVGGRSREVDLGVVLPMGFEAVRVNGDLPARLGASGDLRLQLRPGTWSLDVWAINRDRLERVQRPPFVDPWPTAEVWVYESVPTVRVAQVSGLQSIDPQRTSMPEAWRQLPAFNYPAEASLQLTEIRRGAADPPPDELAGRRDLWLSFDGRQFVARDEFSAHLYQGGRLSPLAPATLGSVELDGVGQVLTVDEAERTGVEVRKVETSLVATLTYPRGGALPAVGWDRDARQLSATLHLPPGWQLIAAPGADTAVGSWLEEWTLLDLFFLLLVVIGGGKQFGRNWGAIALVGLGLAWHEAWVPRVLWLVLLALLALHGWLYRSRRGSRLARVIRGLEGLALLTLLTQLTLFAGFQLRDGFFPHLSDPSLGARGLSNPGFMVQAQKIAVQEEMSALAEVDRVEPPAAPSRSRKGGAFPSGSMRSEYDRSQQFDVDAVVQTGPGVPSWMGEVSILRWSGPVASNHEFRLWLISPLVSLLVTLVRLALILLITGRLFGFIRRRGAGGDGGEAEPLSSLDPIVPSQPVGGSGGPSTSYPRSETGASRLVVLLLVVLSSSTLRAEEPAELTAELADELTTTLLVELERRLTEPPECGDRCLEVSLVDVRAGATTIEVLLDVHVVTPSALPLPGPSQTWTPNRIEVDDVVTHALRRRGDGYLLLRLEAGVHRIRLLGPASESVTLQFPRPPRVLEWMGEGWTGEGGREGETSSLRLTRDRPLDSVEGGEAPSTMASWVTIIRVLDLGIPWRVHSRAERQGSLDEALHLRVPLVAGEQITTAGWTAESGEVSVPFAPGESRRTWTSTLPETSVLHLHAPDEQPWTETWVLDCSPIWNCRAQGVPPTSLASEGRWRPVYQPWPGEELSIDLSRPPAAEGVSTTIESVHWTQRPGRRLVEGQLAVGLESSSGTELAWRLPSDAKLQSFEVDQERHPVRFEAGVLDFSLSPGNHTVEVAWQRDRTLGAIERFPEVDLGMSAANLDLSLEVPENRWVLLTGGPRVGPVIGFWQYVLVLLLVAWVLGTHGSTPLRRRDWFLLGLGLTQVPFPAALIVVGWLLLLGRRPRIGGGRWGYNLLQLFLVFWSMVALGILYAAIHSGLLLSPDMHVAGASSTRHTLRWISDGAAGQLPRPWAVWLPLWCWRLVMLGWALWLAGRLLNWVRWAWHQYTSCGLWQGKPQGGVPTPGRSAGQADLSGVEETD